MSFPCSDGFGTRMWKKPKPAAQPLSSSDQKTSHQEPEHNDPQLSARERVNSDVRSVALDRGLLAMGAHPPAAADSGLSDAEMMLRVKAGDDSAFDYLVQQYRRPI